VTDFEAEDLYAIDGNEIRFMWDMGVIVPLWDEAGHLSDDPAWLRRALGLSDALIADLWHWGEAMEVQDAAPNKGSPEWLRSSHGLDAQGVVLAESLQRELGSRYQVVHVQVNYVHG
jgi:hypothetical protein